MFSKIILFSLTIVLVGHANAQDHYGVGTYPTPTLMTSHLTIDTGFYYHPGVCSITNRTNVPLND
jgi:hypothetical protein